MSIVVNCKCGKAYRLKDELAGKRAKCSGCGGVIEIPLLAAVAPDNAAALAKPPVTSATKLPPVATIAAKAGAAPKTDADQQVADLLRTDSAPQAATSLDDDQDFKIAPATPRAVAAEASSARWDYAPATPSPLSSPAGRGWQQRPPAPKTGNRPVVRGPSALSRWWDAAGPGVLGGLGMTIGGLLWLFLGWQAGRIFFYPIFLIAAGLYKTLNSLIGD